MPEPTPIRGGVAAPWPEPPGVEAYHGLAGDIVRELDPHTEADPVGVLATLLACCGALVGDGPHFILSGAKHTLRTWPVLVGATSSGRKGTALATLRPVFQASYPLWWGRRESGLSSGEGLIWAVRDEIRERKPFKVRGQPEEYRDVVTDPGVEDKRLLVVESEFSNFLQVLRREGNSLSSKLRVAWDGDEPLGSMTRGSKLRAGTHHVTMTGHITPEELTELLAEREAANGLANRFMWVCVRRSKLLPRGGSPDEGTILGIADVLRATIEQAQSIGRMDFDEAGGAAWDRVYEDLTTGEPGLVGKVLGRAAPIVVRLAGLYAVLDGSPLVGVPHIEAALALWGYADASVRHVFGGGKAEPQAPPVAVREPEPKRRAILDFLVAGPQSKTAISVSVFARNLGAKDLTALLQGLVGEGLIAESKERPAGGIGPPVYSYALTEAGQKAVSS